MRTFEDDCNQGMRDKIVWQSFQMRTPYLGFGWTPQEYMPGWTGWRSGDERGLGSFSPMENMET